MSGASVRSVRCFVSWDDAQTDARERGACIVFDCHYRFWSVPTELSIREAHSQIYHACLDGSIPLHIPPQGSPTLRPVS